MVLKTKKQIQIRFGACAPKISTQLKSQNIVLDKSTNRLFDKLTESIYWLYLHGVLHLSEKAKCLKRLNTKILQELDTNKKESQELKN